MTSVYAALASTLRSYGVDSVFGLMGEETAWLTSELTGNDIRYYATRHEATAVGMADGYARASGNVGVALISRGPGLTNALTAITSAHKAHSRVVVIVGEGDIGIPSRRSRTALQSEEKYVDQLGVLAACSVAAVALENPETVIDDLIALLRRAEAGMTLAATLPMDLLSLSAGKSPTTLVLPQVTLAAEAPPVDQISALADLITAPESALRPVILAGRGAVLSGAKDSLMQLGQTIGALMSTTLMAKSYFAEDPFDIGVSGVVGTHLGQQLIRNADLVLAVGTSLDSYTSARGQLFKGSTVVHIDAASAVPTNPPSVNLRITGEARATIDALAAELTRRGYQASGYRTAEIEKQILEYDVRSEFTPVTTDGRVDPRSLMIELDALLPKDRILVADDGHHWTWPAKYLSVPDPESFMFPIEYFAVGSATGLALGAAVAQPDRLVVFCVGDGGMMMTLADIDTAYRYGLNVLTLVTNDEAFGAEVHFLKLTGFPTVAAECESPSFAALARAVGMEATTVPDDGEAKAVAALVAAKRPALADCRVVRDLRAEWIDFHFEHAP